MIAILKEINQTLKEILSELKQQKEPTAVTVDSETLDEWCDSTVGYINQTRKKATDSQMELEKSANRLRGLI
ncbi:hypothetical protein VWV84_08335 [Streptococcus agalactiae]|uniref:hypothetical protein n=1 Tax=Streptococcus agalactiae TaxID=1311 RepID=UPI0002E64777|nr:hypothetical protein [Streptococcus agalactiae]EPW71999.1 hypothetical protein SAG0101_02545 [Streptococcus agalactiae BSU451]QBX23509.1 hypothetical protein Javan14_0007 [Streptococcus phage Javan14]